jgi:hypothetical protein
MAQGLQQLPSKCQAVSSNPSVSFSLFLQTWDFEHWSRCSTLSSDCSSEFKLEGNKLKGFFPTPPMQSLPSKQKLCSRSTREHAAQLNSCRAEKELC